MLFQRKYLFAENICRRYSWVKWDWNLGVFEAGKWDLVHWECMGIIVPRTIENVNGVDDFPQSMALWQFW